MSPLSNGELVHQRVKQDLAAMPEFSKQVKRTGDGDYTIDGREVKVGFCRDGFLVVHDGPLRQPFVDYIAKKEENQQWKDDGLKNSNLNAVPKETRISFGDAGSSYSRLDAMKVAKEQAIYREKAATYMNEGQMVPADLREKYEKAIHMKLDANHRRWGEIHQLQAPGPAPVAAAAPAAPTWWPNNAAMASGMPAPAMTQVNLFGDVPDLRQIAASRTHAHKPTTPRMLGSVKTTMPMFPSASVKLPMQMHKRTVAYGGGRLCGA